jgi:multidrug efflux pump subunit AcrA (membrane-fusion protein)
MIPFLASPGRVRGVCALASSSLLLLSAAGCQSTEGRARNGNRAPAAVAVKTTTIQRITVQRQVELAGNLLSPDQAKVSSEVAGVVRQVLVEIGREVRVGDPLVRLDTKELALALERAESALRQTRAQLGMHGPLSENAPPPPDEEIASVRTALATREDARANAVRAENLAGRRLLSPADLSTAQTQLKVSEAAYQSALDTVRSLKASLQDRRAAYDLAQKKLNDAVVKAPIAGSVSERLVQTGEFISERTPVATIVQINPLKLRTGVQEKYAGAIQAGQAVEFRVESFGDLLFKGKVAYVGPSIDQTMRTFTVEALVDNSDRRLKPGFFTKGYILTRQDNKVMAVPDSAVSTLAGVSSVFVVEDNKIRQVSVTLGPRQGNLWEVLDGLRGDEVLAANNLNQLATGVAVRVLAPGQSDTVPAAGAATGGARRGSGQGSRQGQGPGQGRRARGDRQ